MGVAQYSRDRVMQVLGFVSIGQIARVPYFGDSMF